MGEFEGPHFKGKVLPGSGEWLLIRPDGTAELDVRATLQTEDGAAIYTQYRGYLTNIFQVGTPWLAGESVDHEAYRCAVTATFETGARQYEWLHHVVVIGSVKLTQGGISYQFFSVK
ncbi:DUF3237 domain-containing protein [Ktedonosporobacter rubrisoli]|uniref:DUF3237 domain-containing protein n=1 Tax=Ktedonosporobacter rubrisoli TaxID=2509675 RepID=A0A4P6K3Q6_KTERU|nr:DUF3237 domain-containing protein [Ktedonosporobacter rubrisoli]QBD82908.1 DUF3237 domain-containing protein [Ktedonosporobacter rubrisoli]